MADDTEEIAAIIERIRSSQGRFSYIKAGVVGGILAAVGAGSFGLAGYAIGHYDPNPTVHTVVKVREVRLPSRIKIVTKTKTVTVDVPTPSGGIPCWVDPNTTIGVMLDDDFGAGGDPYESTCTITAVPPLSSDEIEVTSATGVSAMYTVGAPGEGAP